jgi:hypothetical protein
LALRIIENFNCDVRPAPGGRIMLSFQDVIFEDEASGIRLLGDNEGLTFALDAWDQLVQKGNDMVEAIRREAMAAPQKEIEVVRDLRSVEDDGPSGPATTP